MTAHLRVARIARIVEHAGAVKLFGHSVLEATMAQREGGQSPAERPFAIVILIIVTLERNSSVVPAWCKASTGCIAVRPRPQTVPREDALLNCRCMDTSERLTVGR